MARVLEMHGMLAALGSKSGGDKVAESGAFLASRLTAPGHNGALEEAFEEVLAASLEGESDASQEVEIVDDEGALTKSQGAPHSSALGARDDRLQPGVSPGVHAVSEPTDVTATAPETSAATNHNRVVEAIPATRAYWCTSDFQHGDMACASVSVAARMEERSDATVEVVWWC